MAKDSDAKPVLIVCNKESIQKCRLNERAERLGTPGKPPVAKPCSMVHLNKDFHIIWVNEAFEHETGIRAKQLIGRIFPEVYPDSELHSILRNALATGRACRTTSGNTKSCSWIITPLINRTGRIHGLTITQTDSHTPYHTYSLQNSSMQIIIDHVPMAIALVDGRTNRMKCANLAYQNLVSEPYRNKDCAGLSIHEYCPQFAETGFDELLMTVAASGVPYVDPDVQCQNPARGLTFWHISLIPIITAEGMVDVLIVAVDVNEQVRSRKHIEELIDQTEQRAAEMESFLSSIADGVVIYNAEGEAVFVNDAMRDMLGMPATETYSDWIRRCQRLTFEGKPVKREELPSRRALKGETVQDVRYRLSNPWGRQIVVSCSASPVFDRDGCVIGATNVFRDISERIDLEQAKQKLYEREHRIAEILQQALIPPQDIYELGNCRIALKYQPALNEAEVGGDFYDVIDLGEGRVGLLIGDIAGKGLAAAIRVASVRYAIRSYAYINPSPSAVMSLTNEALCRENDDCSELLTAYFAVADVNTGVITYANAGHEPPIVWGGESKISELSYTADYPLGINKGIIYKESIFKLEANDTLIALTDGITEARVGSCLFGKEGVYDFLSTCRADHPEEVAAGLLEAARAHAGGSLQDDAAILVLKWNPALQNK
ncbi:MAG: SpoIIE family protein phosphatase [Armatimonadetes bacterium]|nr:SpoIIE family protein phosphatase [Armatimonadota bacterium]